MFTHIGTSSGAIVHRRKSGHKMKNMVLFEGANTPVHCISWRGAVVAWADSRHIRLLCVTNQTAICFINIPQGKKVVFYI